MKKYRKPICKFAKLDTTSLLMSSSTLMKSGSAASHGYSVLSNSRESDDEDSEYEDFTW